MLIEFTVGNYRSFHEPQTLSLLAEPLTSKNKSMDANNVFQIEPHPRLLTSAAIYGANASGKSNLIGALHFMRLFVLNSPKETMATGGIEAEPFQLNRAAAALPSSFQVVFIMDGFRYRYGFEVNSERVIAEWLYTAAATRESRLFEREGDEIAVGNRFPEGRKLKAQTRPNALFLSVAAQFNGPTAQAILGWFRRLGINRGVLDIPFYTTEDFLNGNRAEAIRELICRLDLGIADLKVERSAISEPEFPDEMPVEIVQALKTLFDAADNEQVTVHTVHTVYDETGRPVGQAEFDLDEHESAGTQKLFSLAGPLLETLETGGLLVIDELDARLHPLLSRELVKLFNNRETNAKGAQLIFTTQDTNLLDNTLFRRDQIWFVEKDRRGASNLYSLAEFKGVRNDLSFERGYIQGRFGAIPYLNLNKLLALAGESNGQGT